MIINLSILYSGYATDMPLLEHVLIGNRLLESTKVSNLQLYSRSIAVDRKC